MDFYNWMQRKYCFTDYQVKVFHYFIISIFSEISKFIIMGIFFYATGRLPYYLWGVCLLSLLRFYSGGLHCKTYMGCLFSSFAYMLMCVQLLPSFSVSRLLQLILLLQLIFRIAVINPVVENIPPANIKFQIVLTLLGSPASIPNKNNY